MMGHARKMASKDPRSWQPGIISESMAVAGLGPLSMSSKYHRAHHCRQLHLHANRDGPSAWTPRDWEMESKLLPGTQQAADDLIGKCCSFELAQKHLTWLNNKMLVHLQARAIAQADMNDLTMSFCLRPFCATWHKDHELPFTWFDWDEPLL